MLSALSAKAQAGEMIVVDGLDMGEIKTKTFAGFLKSVESTGKALVVTPEVRKNIVKSAANIPGVRTTIASPSMFTTSSTLTCSSWTRMRYRSSRRYTHNEIRT